MIKIKNKDLLIGYQVLMAIAVPTTISVNSVTNLLKLTTKVKELLETSDKTLQAVMTSFGLVPNEQGAYDWTGHEQQDAINKKFQEYQNEEHEITDVNFTEDDLVAKLSANKRIGEMMQLVSLLGSQ